ncbi:aminotransferase class V-fold PLP-dependent enzyme [Shigella sonnei]
MSAGNVHRSQFPPSPTPDRALRSCAEKVAQLLNASDDKNIVWTR